MEGFLVDSVIFVICGLPRGFCESARNDGFLDFATCDEYAGGFGAEN